MASRVKFNICGGAGPTAETAPSATGLHSDKNTPTGERDDCLINARFINDQFRQSPGGGTFCVFNLTLGSDHLQCGRAPTNSRPRRRSGDDCLNNARVRSRSANSKPGGAKPRSYLQAEGFHWQPGAVYQTGHLTED